MHHLAFLVVASGSEFVERTIACRCLKRNTTVYTGELTTAHHWANSCRTFGGVCKLLARARQEALNQ